MGWNIFIGLRDFHVDESFKPSQCILLKTCPVVHTPWFRETPTSWNTWKISLRC